MLRIVLEQQKPAWSLLKKQPGFYSATDVSNILGLGYVSRKRFFQAKAGLMDYPEIDSQSPPIRRGRELEPDAILHFIDSQKIPLEVEVYQPGGLLSFDHPLTCSPDALMVNWMTESLFGLETKVPYSEPYLNAKPRPGHLAQVMASLLVSEADGWYLHYYWPEKPSLSRTFLVRPNQPAFEHILQKVEEFEADLEGGSGGLRSVRQRERDETFDLFMKTVYSIPQK